ncbi:MAG: EAL domain-containing protein [Cyanobacteria bacterium P01_D01_bin.6]
MENDFDQIILLSKFFKQEFQLCYQPILSLDQERLYGFEALIAWQPERAQIYSENPIKLVKESQLTLSFYELLFHEACMQMREWQNYYLADLPLKLNIDVPFKQLYKVNALDYVEQSLDKLKLVSNNIQLELSADWILEEKSIAKAFMVRARKMGLSICVDDLELSIFLTDFWKDMPVNTFKLRKGSIKALASELDIRDSFRKTLSTTQKSTKILVQDVENFDQLEFLKDLGCTHCQSSFLSELICPRQATTLIRTYVRQQPQDLVFYLSGMNIISRIAENFFGHTTVMRYWKTTRPIRPWLVLIEPYKEHRKILESTQLTKLSMSRRHDLRKWVYQFITYSTSIIKHFPMLLTQASLTEYERRILCVLLPDLF